MNLEGLVEEVCFHTLKTHLHRMRQLSNAIKSPFMHMYSTRDYLGDQ